MADDKMPLLENYRNSNCNSNCDCDCDYNCENREHYPRNEW